MRGDTHQLMRPLVRTLLGRLFVNAQEATALSATASLDAKRDLHSHTGWSLRPVEQNAGGRSGHGGGASVGSRVRAVYQIVVPGLCLDSRGGRVGGGGRGGDVALLSTSSESTIAAASSSDVQGEPMTIFASSTKERDRIPFRRKGGDRYARSRTNSVIASLVKSLEAAQSNAEVVQILEQRSEELLRPNSWPWLPLLDALQKGPKPNVAMEVFNWKKSKMGWEANPKEYAKMISFAGRISQPQLAADLFNEMETRGIRKTAVVFNALIHSYGRNDEAQKALQLFQDMKDTVDCQPTLVTYNTLISMYSRLGSTEEMKQIFVDCKEAGFSPDRHTYNALIWGYMRSGQLKQMEETYNELKRGECKADVITYNAQIIGYARANAVDKMEDTFTSMQMAGIPINVMVGEILVEVYSRTRQFAKVEGALKIMEDTAGVQYGSRVHSMVIESYADAGRLDDMEMAVTRMFQNNRMFVSPRTLEALVVAYAKAGEYDRLTKTIDVVRGAGWNIQSNIYNLLISEYGKAGYYDRMEQIFSEMSAGSVKLAYETYQAMVEAYDRVGNEAEVERILDLMRKAGIDPPKSQFQPSDRMWTDDEIFGGKSR